MVNTGGSKRLCLMTFFSASCLFRSWLIASAINSEHLNNDIQRKALDKPQRLQGVANDSSREHIKQVLVWLTETRGRKIRMNTILSPRTMQKDGAAIPKLDVK